MTAVEGRREVEPADQQVVDPPPSKTNALLLFVPVLAALGPFASMDPGTSGSLYAYRLIIMLLIVPSAVTVVGLLRERDSRLTALALTTFMVATWGTYALGWTPNTERGSRQLIGILISQMGAWVVIATASRHRSSLDALRNGYLLAAVVMCALGVWQYLTGNNLWSQVNQPFNFSGNPLIGTFVNPNNYAAFLLCCLGPILASIIRTGFWSRTIAVVTLPVLAWALLESTSRAGLIGLAVIIFMGLVITGTKVPRFQVPILMMSIVGVLGTWLVAGRQIDDLINAAFRNGSGGSDQLRVELSRIAGRYFVESNGLGIGPAGFPVQLAADTQQAVTRVLPAHNTFLEMAAEYGAPVALPFFMLMGALVMGTLRSASRSTSAGLNSVRVELLAGLIAIVSAGLVASSVIADPSWWLLIGYLILLVRRSERDSAAEMESEQPSGQATARAR